MCLPWRQSLEHSLLEYIFLSASIFNKHFLNTRVWVISELCRLTLSSCRWSSNFLKPSQNSMRSQYTGYCSWKDSKYWRFEHVPYIDQTVEMRRLKTQTDWDDSVAPACQSQHLLEKHFCSSTDRRKEDDGTPDALRPRIVEWPHLTVVVVDDDLGRQKRNRIWLMSKQVFYFNCKH